MSGVTVVWRGVAISIPPEIESETAEVTEAYELASFAKALGWTAEEVLAERAREAEAVAAHRAAMASVKNPKDVPPLAFPDLTPRAARGGDQ